MTEEELLASINYGVNAYLERIESLEQQLSTVKAELAASQAKLELYGKHRNDSGMMCDKLRDSLFKCNCGFDNLEGE